jgi:hypothetical protein
MPEPYDMSARFYDRIYGFKDYAAEAEAVRTLVNREHPSAGTMLEVG